jgi:hypothetical protein
MTKYFEGYDARISCNLADRKKTDEECSQDRNSQCLANYLTRITVCLPLLITHFRTVFCAVGVDISMKKKYKV